MNTNETLNICFVSNFTKTYVFNAVAQQLQKNYKCNIFWIVVNQKYKLYLESHYDTNSILYIHKGLPNHNSKHIGEYKLNEIVYNDRFFSKNIEEGLSFLKTIQTPIYDFIKKNEITHIFGEATWSHELLINRITKDKKELNCKFLNPNVVRLPNDRFTFFSNEKEDMDIDEKIDYEKLGFPLIKLQKQEYIKAFDEIIAKSYSLKVKLARATRFFTKVNIEKNDPSLPYKINQRFVRGTKQEIYRSTYKLLNKINIEDIGEREFVFYPLHVQPEASIDVMGKYYNNQWQNIINIWKLLPNNWILIVKEHSNGIGDRSLKFYKKIAALPNVFIISEKTNSHELIKKCKAIFTVSGTVGYEAALMQKTAFTFAPMFFNKLQYCHKITLEDFSNFNNLFDLIEFKNSTNNQKMDLQSFSNFIYFNSYEGTWEPLDEKVLTEKNIENLANSIIDRIKKQI
jgi:hypothetical protein